MPLVDQLAAVLGDLAVGERAAQGPAAAAETVGGLVEVGRVAGLLQLVGAGEPRQPAADDRDPWCGGRVGHRHAAGERAGDGETGSAREDVASGQSLRALGANLINRYVALDGFGDERCGL